jgi:hypothetical protein
VYVSLTVRGIIAIIFALIVIYILFGMLPLF